MIEDSIRSIFNLELWLRKKNNTNIVLDNPPKSFQSLSLREEERSGGIHEDVHDAFRAAIYARVISREISREGSRDKSNFLVAEVRAAEKEAPWN